MNLNSVTLNVINTSIVINKIEELAEKISLKISPIYPELGRFRDRIDKYLLVPNSDGTYDYNGTLDFSNMKLTSLSEIPIKFRTVNGSFYYQNNDLADYKGMPVKVHGNFF